MYDNYFSPEELKQLPFAQPNPERDEEWAQLVRDVTYLMAQGIPAEELRSQALASRWMSCVERDTACNAVFFNRLNQMYLSDSTMQDKTGITPEKVEYMVQAFSYRKLAIYRRYLNDDEYCFTAKHYFDRMMDWPPLVAAIQEAVIQQCAPESDEAQALAQQWLILFTSFAGNHPQTQQKFRLAMAAESELLQGTWMTLDMLTWLRLALVLRQKKP